VYWQVIMLGVATAVAVVMLGLVVFMPPTPPAPPQLYVKVIPSSNSYLLYVSDSGKALKEVWYSKNGGPLIMANGPIRVECGDRVEVVAVYADGSRQTAAAVVKCTKPLTAQLSTTEVKPDPTTFVMLEKALGEAVNGLMGNLPYNASVTNKGCGSGGAAFEIKIQPQPYGSYLGAKIRKVYENSYDDQRIGVGTTMTGFYITIPGAPNSANIFFCGGAISCSKTREARYDITLNYTAPTTSAFSSDYQGEAKSNVALYVKSIAQFKLVCDSSSCYYVPTDVAYWVYWNGGQVGYCEWKQDLVKVTIDEPIFKRYNETCVNSTDVFLQNVNVNGQSGSGYAGVTCLKVWYKGSDPSNKNNWVKVGIELTYAKAEELYKNATRGGNLTVTYTPKGTSVTLSVPLNTTLFTYSDTGSYVHTCNAGLCRLYTLFDPTYIAGYKVYGWRLVGFATTFVSIGSETGVGFGLQIPDLYFMTTINQGNYKVNKTSDVTVYINGQQATTYQATYYYNVAGALSVG